MEPGIDYRPERPGDAAAIRELVRSAFANAPHSAGTEPAIVDALRKAGALRISRVAVDADSGSLIGHVAISPVTVASGSADWFGLGPVSVHPSRQHTGIGSRLIRDALALLCETGSAGCVVLGEPSYYRRFGFLADARLQLVGFPPAYFQALSFSGALARGVVRYHPAFDVSA